MKVSIIIPCHNYGRYLHDAVSSALAQTYHNIEVIVVNDNSTDNTDEVMQSFTDARITYLKQNNGSPAASRNNGIIASTGEWILPLDADDVISPNYVKDAIAIVSSDSDIITTDTHFYDECLNYTNSRWQTTANPSYDLITNANAVCTCSLFSKKLWELVGGYDTSKAVKGYEDWDLWIRMVKAGGVVKKIDKEHYFKYRKHGPSLYEEAFARHNEIIGYMSAKYGRKIG